MIERDLIRNKYGDTHIYIQHTHTSEHNQLINHVHYTCRRRDRYTIRRITPPQKTMVSFPCLMVRGAVGTLTRLLESTFYDQTSSSSSSSTTTTTITNPPPSSSSVPFSSSSVNLLAAEPNEGMRKAFAQALPHIPLTAASADELPYPDSSICCVCGTRLPLVCGLTN